MNRREMLFVGLRRLSQTLAARLVPTRGLTGLPDHQVGALPPKEAACFPASGSEPGEKAPKPLLKEE